MNHPPIELPPNPKNLDEALSSISCDLWVKAVEKELGQFDDRKVLSSAPPFRRAMKSKTDFNLQIQQPLLHHVQSKISCMCLFSDTLPSLL